MSLEKDNDGLAIPLQELMARRDKFVKDRSRWYGLFLYFFFGLIFVNIPVAMWLDNGANSIPKWLSTLWTLFFIGMLFGSLFFMAITSKKRLLKHDLLCPKCKKPIIDMTMQLAIATGRCSGCAELLVSNHPRELLKSEMSD